MKSGPTNRKSRWNCSFRRAPVELNRFAVGILTPASRLWGFIAAGRSSQTVLLAGTLFNPLLEQTPRPRGSVQRDCIRQAVIGLGEGDRSLRPAGYNFLHFRAGVLSGTAADSTDSSVNSSV